MPPSENQTTDNHPNSPEIRQLVASDGYCLHFRHWLPHTNPPRGYVVCLHGIQSHSGWYDYSSARLRDAGYDVRFADRRGSGLNSVDRGHTPHADRLIADAVHFLTATNHERVRTQSNAPVILLGQSWGAKLAVAAAVRRPDLIDGLVLLYPGLFSKVGPTRTQSILLRLAGWLCPKRRVRIPLDDPAMFTGSTEWQQFIRDDELALHEATVQFLLAGRNLNRIVASAPPRVKCPVLLALAGRDAIIDNSATRAYFNRLAGTQNTLLEFPDAQHTLEFEPNRAEIFDKVLHWLTETIFARAG